MIRRERLRKINKNRTPLKKLPPIPKDLLEVKPSTPKVEDEPFILKITDKLLDKFPSISRDTLSSVKRNITIEEYSDRARADILLDLVEGDLAFEICNKEIGKGFIEATLDNEDIEGFTILFKNEFIGFVFYELKREELKIELICVKKKKGTLKGLPLGQIIMELVFGLTKFNGKKWVALESVTNEKTKAFYRKLGFKMFGKPLPSGLLLLKKKIK